MVVVLLWEGNITDTLCLLFGVLVCVFFHRNSSRGLIYHVPVLEDPPGCPDHGEFKAYKDLELVLLLLERKIIVYE